MVELNKQRDAYVTLEFQQCTKIATLNQAFEETVY